ncbi:MAG TPA: radical SAM protein [Herbaspirillum sp.]|uniref:radical SAM/SPASM domain-containing protein n=1 Tax=Herbaspirillum sp. TaxID=1890675 RepID=UPI002D328E3F|nr:radical SAM protein [Herbaspirillum sp.]HZG18621.1 radical SAM protein [Herbaspirillum sp.]
MIKELGATRSSPVRLGDHRTLRLRDGNIALLSTLHTGWAILSEMDFSVLPTWLETYGHLDTLSATEQETLSVLQNAGLVDSLKSKKVFSPQPHDKKTTTVLVKVTGSCNLRCSYCYDYESTRFHQKISLDRTKSVLSSILENQDALNIAFHGGEPLLRPDFIRDIISFLEAEYKDEKSLRYSLQTNGALLSADIVRFLKEKKFNVGISVDGFSRRSNQHRMMSNGKSSFDIFQRLIADFGDFIKSDCGILSVISRSSINEIPEFCIWLQELGISGYSMAFMDATGRGHNLKHEIPTPIEAVNLLSSIVRLIRSGELSSLNVSLVTSAIDNLFNFQPRDFCNRGPCAAANEFVVLDAEGALRSCDIIYHPIFKIGDISSLPKEDSVFASRSWVSDRHIWLRDQGNECSTCSLFGLCGGTCAGKAISSTGEVNSIDAVTCAVSKYLYREILEEISERGVEGAPLVLYYLRHRPRTTNSTLGVNLGANL